MRILTWNINGIATLPNYHPWTKSSGNWDKILDQIGADIICVQETKITRDKIKRSMCLLDNYDSFFSSYARKPPKGYSGTAIFTKKAACVPLKAEEGITGIIQADNLKTIPTSANVGCYPSPATIDALDIQTSELRDLDIEGRATIVDLGLFVLINFYCPNQTNDDRLVFKMAYNAMIEARVAALVQAGRQVMVVGDINICSQEIDHCEPNKGAKEEGFGSFAETPPRKWFNRFIGPNGFMIDALRAFHPTRRFMYTCWETRINARETNYGTRIDYVLVTPGLMPWIKAADIQADVKGSDHCPVYVDLHDSITDADGQQIDLWPLVNPPGRTPDGPVPDPPLFAARFYPEHAQSLLSTFFGKKTDKDPVQQPLHSPEEELSVDAALARLRAQPDTENLSQASSSKVTLGSSLANSSSASPIVDLSTADEPSMSMSKTSLPSVRSQTTRPSSSAPAASSSKSLKAKGKQKASPEQKSMKDFFVQPKKSGKKRRSSDDDDDLKSKRSSKRSKSQSAKTNTTVAIDVDEIDGAEAADMVESHTASVEAWTSLFGNKKPAPMCDGHSEPCQEWTVNKSGVNKGRKFWLCARPVGPGHSKREKTTEFRCDHFEWETNVTRPYLVSKGSR